MSTPTLYQFFRRKVEQGFGESGIREAGTVDYVSDLLTRFAHTSALYAPDSRGRPLESVVQHLTEHAEGEAERRDRSRQVFIMRHLGEYTLFMSGLFRARLQARAQLGYYVDHGRSAYWTVADFEHNQSRARVFRRLYFDFERISDALDRLWHEHLPLTPTGRPGEPLAIVWRL
ncbi:MAG TPA: hypothetical protein VFN52_05360 [Acidiferrobacteraceae bacterium]|nr:hypothetical protein [Acidiferrobacteraceae bacterium]